MAMIKCPECGGAISSTVDACIHCGFKLTSEIKYEYGIMSEEEYMKILADLPYKESMPLYEKLASKNNLYACKLIGKSYLYGWNGYPVNFAKAKEYFLKFEDSDSESIFYLALIFEKEHKGQKSAIIENYKKVSENKNLQLEDKGTILNNIAVNSSGEEQILNYKKAYDCGNYMAVRNLLGLYITQNKYDETISFGEKVLQDTNILNSDKSRILNYVGIAYVRKTPNDHKNALLYFKKAFECDKTWFQTACNYLDSCICLGNSGNTTYYDIAISFGKEVLQLNPQKNWKGQICNYIGMAYRKQNQIDDARQFYLTGKTCGDENCSMWYDKLTSGMHCPYCGSGNVHKISLANKAASVGFFGIFSAGHVSKTYKCDNCGCKW